MSVEILELELDYLRETGMDSISQSFTDQRVAAKVFMYKKFEGKSYLYVQRGLEREEVFVFPV